MPPTIPLPLTDASLHLAPQLPGSTLALNLLVFGLGAVFLATLAAMLYRYESRLVARRAGFLLALRVLGLLLLWSVIWLRPVVKRPATEVLDAQVVVAVDRSASMATADPQRSPREKLLLARRYGLLGDVPPGTLESWLGQAQGDAAPVLRTPLGSEDLDAAAKYKALVERVDAVTRAEWARRLLAPEGGGGLLDTIAAKHRVSVDGVAQELAPLPEKPDALRAALSEPAPLADGTDLRAPLSRALERNAPDRNPVVGVVLITDGQHNWGPPPGTQAAELIAKGIPVYPVVLGPRKPPADIAVTQFSGPSSVFERTDAVADAQVQVTNLPAGRVKVTLKGENPSAKPGEQMEPQTQWIDHDGTDRAYPLRFRPRLDRAGTETLTLSAEPDGGQRDDHPSNNSRQLRVSVAPEKARVLLADGEARWEFHYLAGALVRDPTMDLDTVAFKQPRLDRVPEGELMAADHPALGLPQEPDAFAAYDCIILGDVTAEELPLAERNRLERYVAEGGGTLVLLSGKRAMPLAFGQPLPGGEPDPLGRMLPIQSPVVVNPREGFPVTLTAEGRRTAYLQMESDPGKSLERWAKLPKQFWGVTGKAKDGAVALAYVEPPEPLPKNDPTGKAAIERERNNALIVRQNYGFGRVLFVGLDATWRWRFKAGDRYHHQFWGQVIRWAATDKPLVAGDANVRFGSRDPVYRSNQEVEVMARLAERIKKPSSGGLMGMRLIRLDKEGDPGKAVGMIPLKATAARPRELAGAVRDLPPGDYALEPVLPEVADQLAASAGPGGDPSKMRAKFKVLPPDSAESTELAANWPLLERVAADTNGKLFTLENADELADLLRDKTVTREVSTETKAWQSWWTLGLFLLLVSAEWVTRKAVGLP